MHLIMLLSILALACGLRYIWPRIAGDAGGNSPKERLRHRWYHTLELFLLPPLLLLTSAIAIIWMGPHGQMVWVWEGWLSYFLAIGFLGFVTLYLLKLTWDSHKILQQIRIYPIVHLHNHRVRILDSIALYSAQIGFWQPELVITQGLIDTLDPDHLAAVLAHEQAHYYYRDTFWFFWLGWVRRMISWLPQTETMWQELLVLRELRADRWASKQTDPLLVAEALLLVVQNTPVFTEPFCAAFHQIDLAVGIVSPLENRLNQRIEALLMIEEVDCFDQMFNWWSWLCLSLTLLPLLTVPFHV